MNARLTLILGFLILIGISCKKSTEPEEPAKTEPIKVISKIFNITRLPTTVTNFTYDDQGRVILEKSDGYEVSYVYKSGKPFQLIYVTARKKLTAEIVFQGEEIKNIYFKGKEDNWDLLYYFNFIYANGKLTRIDKVQDNMVWIKYDFQYDGVNISKKTSDDHTTVTVQDLKFDTQKSIFYNFGSSLIEARSYVLEEFYSMNNLISVQTNLFQDGAPFSVPIKNVFTFTYDNEGYPLTGVRESFIANNPPQTARFRYEYKTLDQ